MALERLAPLGDEGGEPTPQPAGAPTRRSPSPTQAWGVTAERAVEAEGRRAPRRQKPRKAWPTREEREVRAEAKAEATRSEIAQDPAGYARQVCLQLLQIGPRTRAELATALARKGVPEDTAEEVLSRFAEFGIIDDALFASLWVSSRHRGRGLAGRALTQELRRKGVDDETVRDAVEQLSPDEEAETARGLVRRKLAGTRGLPTEARVRRLAGLLARKGYGAGLAFRIVKEELEREGSDPPELSFDALQALDDD